MAGSSAVLKKFRIVLSLLLAVSAVFLTQLSAFQPVYAASSVPYVDQNGNPLTAATTTDITAGTTAWTAGWYSLADPASAPVTTITSRIVVTGDVYLILNDGGTLNARAGITVSAGGSLTIYGQSQSTGILNACWDGSTDSSGNPMNTSVAGGFAGIGGDATSSANATPGAITINGGIINAAGGDMSAAIGGASNASNNTINGSGGNISINNGTVKAYGVGWRGSGIGGGGNGPGGNITITGGTVTAVGGGYGSAGIGGGGPYNSPGNQGGGNGGTIVISGGTVTATGNSSAYGGGAGIGGAGGGNSDLPGNSGNITITGNAVINATGGGGGTENFYTGGGGGAAIGSGGSDTNNQGQVGNIFIASGTVSLTLTPGIAQGSGRTNGAQVGYGGYYPQPAPGNPITNIIPTAPQTLTAGGAQLYQITLTWPQPVSTGLPVAGYYVQWSTDNSTWSAPVNAGNVLTYDVTGLNYGTLYYFQVAAFNAASNTTTGYNWAAASGSTLPPGPPSAPQNVAATAGDGQAAVTFAPPAQTNGGDVIGYTVTASDGSNQFTATGTSSPITISNLTNGTTYSVTVTAANFFGTSPASSPAVSVTPVTVPTAPQSVTATPGDTQITVNFTPPASNGGNTITGYTVSISPAGAGGASTFTGTSSPITIQNLVNGTAYSVTVTATNSVGTGPASSPAASATPLTTPSAPQNLVATAGNGQAALTWTAPASNGGNAITSYQYSTNGGSTWTTITGSSSSTTNYTVTGLTNGNIYNLAVRAVNAAGGGTAAAATSTPYTIPSAPQSLAAAPGNGQAALTWAAPASDGGSAITSYQYSINGGSTWTTIPGSGSSTTSYTVTGLLNGTVYSLGIRAVNAAGAGDSALVTSTPVAAPSAPQNLTATPGNAMVTFTWAAPANDGGSAITLYRYTLDGGSTYLTVPGGTATSYTISPATNGTAYNFGVKAQNAAGLESAAVFIQATPSTVPNAPMNLAATAGNGTIRLTWSPPSNDGGSAITGYTVTATPGDGSSAVVTTNAVSPLDMTGLTNGVTYSIYVYAINIMGSGPNSEIVTATPYTVPTAPQGLAAAPGNGQITLSWAAPSSDGGSAVTSYQYMIDSGAWTTIPGSGASTTSHTFTGLTNGTSYTLAVRAVNAAGAGASDSVSSTPVAVPSAPQNLTATPGTAQVTLAWTAPANTGGSAISGYTVTISPANSSSVTVFPAAASPINITGLVPGTVYTFAVTATNSAGTGSSATTSGSPLSPPSAPQNVAVSAGDGQATVTFSPPSSDGGSSVTGYTVTISPAASGGATVSGAASPVIVTGLTDGTLYTFTVTATNTVGTGAASSAVTATPITVPATPTSVGVTQGGTGQLEVSFTAAPTAGAPITSFTVTATPTDGSAPVSATGTANPMTIGGLAPGTSYMITVSATNARGSSAPSAAVQATTSGTAQIIPARLPAALIGVAYNQTFSYSGFPAPTSWSLASGALPPGLTLNSVTGAVSGTPAPQTRGAYTFSVTADNGVGTPVTQSITMTVGARTSGASVTDFGVWSGSGTVSAWIDLDYYKDKFEDLVFAGTYKPVPIQYYTAAQGSTIITFTEAYLNSLPNGEYWFIAEFASYDTRRIELIVDRHDNRIGRGSDSPDTGDDPYTLLLTTWLAVISALSLVMLSFYYRLAYGNSKRRK